MPTKDEIYEKIKAALVDALGVDEDEITPEATLVGDLGAESIDFLDIVFRLEKAFDIKIPRGELFPEDVLTDPKYVQDGQRHRRRPGRTAQADALCQPRRLRQEPGRAGLRQPAHRGRHVPLRGKQGASDRLRTAAGSRRWARDEGFSRCAGIWIDRFLEFESGRYAKAIKYVSLAEDYLHDHFPQLPVIPNSLVIEGLAQTGGLLVCEHNQFTEKVILAKIPKVEFFCEAVPGDTLTYTATIEYINAEGAAVTATSHKGDRAAGRGGDRLRPPERPLAGHVLFARRRSCAMMRLFGAYRVGHAADGSPLAPPPRLLQGRRRLQRPAAGRRARRNRTMRRRVVVTGIGWSRPWAPTSKTSGSGCWPASRAWATPRSSTPATSPPRSPPRSATGTSPTWARIPTTGSTRAGTPISPSAPPRRPWPTRASTGRTLDPTRFGVYTGSGEGQQDFDRFTEMMVAGLNGGAHARHRPLHPQGPGNAQPDRRVGAGAEHAGRPPGQPLRRPGAERQLPDGLRRQQPGRSARRSRSSAAARPT